MSRENPLWGAPRIHGELLKLGIEVAQSSLAKYMVKRRAPPSQGWRTFLRNHALDIAAMDLFVVPTIRFDLLCVPKTLFELMTCWNLLNWRNDRTVSFRFGHPGLAIQVEVAA